MCRSRSLAPVMPLLASAIMLTPGCEKSVCDCYDGSLGLMITAPAPVTNVTLSGAACSKGQFRCWPEDLDSKIHGDCKSIHVVANAEGPCLVDLTIGGVVMRLERHMRRSTCDCYGTYYTEVDRAGEIDLRGTSDGGVSDLAWRAEEDRGAWRSLCPRYRARE